MAGFVDVVLVARKIQDEREGPWVVEEGGYCLQRWCDLACKILRMFGDRVKLYENLFVPRTVLRLPSGHACQDQDNSFLVVEGKIAEDAMKRHYPIDVFPVGQGYENEKILSFALDCVRGVCRYRHCWTSDEHVYYLRNPGRISFEEARKSAGFGMQLLWMAQLARAVADLHRRWVVHGGLQESCLFVEEVEGLVLGGFQNAHFRIKNFRQLQKQDMTALGSLFSRWLTTTSLSRALERSQDWVTLATIITNLQKGKLSALELDQQMYALIARIERKQRTVNLEHGIVLCFDETLIERYLTEESPIDW